MSIVNLKCLSRYRTASKNYQAGTVYPMDESEALYLLKDSPGSFAIEVEPETVKALDEPPANKMMKQPTRKK